MSNQEKLIQRTMECLCVFGLLFVIAALLSGCTMVGLNEADKTKVVEAALEDGKTEWCVKIPMLEPLCVTKERSSP
jgi:hypothetical protein